MSSANCSQTIRRSDDGNIQHYNQRGQDEIVEKKSRFIGYAVPVSTEEEAYAFVERIKKQHYDARHNCFAFAIGSENTLLRFSDDGEPQERRESLYLR